MGLFDLFSKKQREANQSFLSQQRSQQIDAKIEKLTLPANFENNNNRCGCLIFGLVIRLAPLV